jgi:hypothetical protein
MYSFLKEGQYLEQFPFFSGAAKDGVIQLKKNKNIIEKLLQQIITETETNAAMSTEMIRVHLLSLFITVLRDSVPNAVAYLEREYKVIEQTVNESRATDEDTKKLKELSTAIDHLRGQIEAIQLNEPHRAEEMSRWDYPLKEIKTKMVGLRYQMFKRKYL